jgi:hypothetical protein
MKIIFSSQTPQAPQASKRLALANEVRMKGQALADQSRHVGVLAEKKLRFFGRSAL